MYSSGILRSTPRLIEERDSTHPEIPKVAAVLSTLEGARQERARQLLYWCVLNDLAPADPAAFEREFDACVGALGGSNA